ncbi:hypothetical protein [Mycobacterium intracellulare]|uniref:Uncharacterized protein n=1 Tax=Mycobacterium intracellulare subsp. chimaera TaxID=222805 RepID=A0ABT7P3A0_MYCIT|nr:hypothetical protein [Mycobacterium intracellulare]MDM3927763.1 hypothetical protein [Mycobacterium intracellulare subsp. chimaera]
MSYARSTPRGELAFREQLRPEASTGPAQIGASTEALVTHPDRRDVGRIVDSAAPAWTPDELTVAPPAAGMVKVCWFDSADPTQLFWEYADELKCVTDSTPGR